MSSRLWIDLETFSETPISVGAYRYAEDADILLVAYAFDDEPARVVDVAGGELMPQRILDHAGEVWAHNANFDRVVLSRFFPQFANPRRWRDTMVLAYSASMPGSLGALCKLLRLPVDQAKDEDGRKLIQLFCKPRPACVDAQLRLFQTAGGQTRGSRVLTRDDRPQEWARFVDYARRDVEAMREVWRRLPKVNDTPEFWAQWHLDQAINDRGMAIDLELTEAAIKAATEARIESDETVQRVTGGKLATAGQRDAMLRFLCEECGVTLPDFQRSTLERRLNEPGLPEHVRELLAARLASGKASVKKFDTLRAATSSDGRLRGCLQFCGASRTGRWSGRLFQPQNLPRGSRTPAEVETGIGALKAGLAPLLYDDVSQLVSDCLRGAIVAGPGNRLVVADLSNIEGRVLAWLAGERWKLDAFRAFDRGEGVDLYCATYGRTFGIDPRSVTKAQRQIGKVLELAMGYQGGVSAFLVFARGYGVDLDDLARITRDNLAREYLDEAAEAFAFFDEKGMTYGLSRDTFIALDAIKRAWRAAHPAIVALWASAEEAALRALREGGEHPAGRLHYCTKDGSLWCRLPSGRGMAYPAARPGGRKRTSALSYWGQHMAAKGWGFIDTYAGRLVENATQATARDILAESMAAIEERGFRIVLSVHDELLTEAPIDSDLDVDELSRLMATPPAWAADLPLAAAGFEGTRYRKG